MTKRKTPGRGPRGADKRRGGRARAPSATVAGARDQLPSLVHQAEDGGPVEITRRGRPVAVLLGYHEYQRLLGEAPSFWDAMQSWRNASGAVVLLDDQSPPARLFPRDRGTGRPPPF